MEKKISEWIAMYLKLPFQFKNNQKLNFKEKSQKLSMGGVKAHCEMERPIFSKFVACIHAQTFERALNLPLLWCLKIRIIHS